MQNPDRKPSSSAPNANVTGAGSLGFIQEDLLDETPPGTSIADFWSPKLRKFRKHDQRISWRKYVGYGMDGIVFRVRFGDGDGPFALKVFWKTFPPTTPLGLHHMYTPSWAFEMECKNAARIEALRWAICQSDEPIVVSSNPRGKKGAMNNVYAFTDEGRSRPVRYDDPQPMPAFPDITRCYGWLKLRRRDIPRQFERLRWTEIVGRDVDPNVDYQYALVYDYVDDAKIMSDQDVAEMQSQLDFFHLTGFSIHGYQARNWRRGRLVDFNEIVFCDRRLGWNEPSRIDALVWKGAAIRANNPPALNGCERGGAATVEDDHESGE
ncbi:hypothetical protein CCM_00541 [Cordyceps militaris CM01]|uniref:Uncharacterized protein n=1 Tax=Cordyceps militaris (strain CM01) TaxID=983644 RepID=G3J4L7_CORMM|nr:uncharacterized protein CCM_00541 [Cordyceps militaris CM01]EGX95887.1 hypothetical protein CCM_00541 [Cordyceps militaris CM01]